MQREVGETEVARAQHERLVEQYHQRQHDGHREEREEQRDDDGLCLAQAQQRRAPALAADGRVGPARADQLLIDEDVDGGDGDQHQADRCV